jgi:GNAT superfamily N-acetyltransferase
MGRVFVDQLLQPAAYCLTVGPFWYYAGDAQSPGGYQLMRRLPAYQLLMPSPPAWLEAAQELYGASLTPFTRYSFSADQLSPDHLARLLERSPFRRTISPIDAQVAQHLAEQNESYLDLSDYDSVADFVERGLGYVALDHGGVMGIAYSSLVCSQGIELSVYVEPAYRRQGVATALGSQLLLECLSSGMRPNWDAANPESVKLATKLGYVYQESYQAYYHT